MMKPLIGVSGCAIKDHEGRTLYKSGDKYIHVIADQCNASPVIIPPLADKIDKKALLYRLDGLFLTGSSSNIEPRHYHAPAVIKNDLRDTARDQTILPLIREAVSIGLPIFAVCRGLQELNVALGGTLHQQIHMLPNTMDHRSDNALNSDTRYEARHTITIKPDSILSRILKSPYQVKVNSLHGQAIDRLATSLKIEAESEDGIIEAISAPQAPGFVLGVQWHPEHPIALKQSLNQKLFQAFGQACKDYMTDSR